MAPGRIIGLIGGLSWESSALYYRLINGSAARRLGGHHNARSVMVTVDFEEALQLASAGRWPQLGELLADAARRLESAGADFIVITSNTGHAAADAVEAAVSLPLLHIADVAARAIRAAGLSCVGMIGTRTTLEGEFYVGRLRKRHGIDVRIPPQGERDALHAIILDELTVGKVEPASRARVREIARRLSDSGAGGILVGCTELPLLVREDDFAVRGFDTVRLHAEAAVDVALGRHGAGEYR
ncbi:MAG: aspartate/glutamate racemase family protein [Burkholderiales bacterium]